ncbi:hypothetical protein RRG08_001603 [Elysia crispata]|uniref:Uncharacterized protein n=1 Tax=Elysia crispata TaxID=231223 RepID=A0AAE1AKB9_9GAST|nr:hypothetical protein RRG08_001603 [Elysia crispata]
MSQQIGKLAGLGHESEEICLLGIAFPPDYLWKKSAAALTLRRSGNQIYSTNCSSCCCLWDSNRHRPNLRSQALPFYSGVTPLGGVPRQEMYYRTFTEIHQSEIVASMVHSQFLSISASEVCQRTSEAIRSHQTVQPRKIDRKGDN